MSSNHDTDDLFVQLTEVLDKLRTPDLLRSSLPDEEEATSIQSLLSDEELLHQFTIENTSYDDVEMIDDKSDQMKSAEKKQPSKKVLFEAIELIESFTLFENGNISKQLQKYTVQLNKMPMSS